MTAFKRPEQEIEIKTIKNTIAEIEPSAEIVLFGSRARKDNDSSSDYDLLVLLQDENIDNEKRNRISQLINKELAKNLIPIDLIVTWKNQFEHKKNITGNLFKTIAREGVWL